MTKPPCSRVSCDKCGCPMENSFEEALIAKCRVPFLGIDDPVAVADVLNEAGVISIQNHDEIRETVKVGKIREAKQTLFCLVSNRPNWFQSLTSALENEHVDCPHTAQKLREVKSNLEKTYEQANPCPSDDDVFESGETSSSREPLSLVQSDSGGDRENLYQECASCCPADREENPYSNIVLTPEEHPYDHLNLLRRKDEMERGVQDPNAEATLRRDRPSLPRRPVNSDSLTIAALVTGHRRAVSDATPTTRRHSMEGPKTCPVYAQRQVDQKFFSSDSSYNDVRSMKGWASKENVHEAEQWLTKGRKGSYFMYGGDGHQVVLAVKFESGVERFHVEKIKSSGLGEYKLQGHQTTKKTRRELLDFLIRVGLRSKQHAFEILRFPWRSATS